MNKLVYLNSNVKKELIIHSMLMAISDLDVMTDHYIVVKSDTVKFVAEFDGIKFDTIRCSYSNKKYNIIIEGGLRMVDIVVNIFSGIESTYGQLFMDTYLNELHKVLINDDNNSVLVVACDSKYEAESIYESKAYKTENGFFVTGIDFMNLPKRQYYVVHTNGEFNEIQLGNFLEYKGIHLESNKEANVTELGNNLYLLGFEDGELVEVFNEVGATLKAKNVKNQSESGFTLVGKDCDIQVYEFDVKRYEKFRRVSDKIISLI